MTDRTPSSWPRRLLLCLGYVALALTFYLVALWRLLPYAELSNRAEATLRAQGIGAELSGLGTASLFGVAADSLTLYLPEEPERRWELTSLRFNLLPRRLLSGETAAAVRSTTLGGELELTGLWQQPPRLDAEWTDVQLALLPLPPEWAALPLAGLLSGTVQFAADLGSPTRGDGVLHTTLRDVTVGAGKVQGIPVPAVRLGDGTLLLRMADGKLEIETAEFKNGDLELSFTGNVILREDLPRSLVNGMLSLRPNEQVAQDLALLFALFPAPKDSDGRYTARLRGNLGAPRLIKR